jgi:hypothetical protein
MTQQPYRSIQMSAYISYYTQLGPSAETLESRTHVCRIRHTNQSYLMLPDQLLAQEKISRLNAYSFYYNTQKSYNSLVNH